MTDPVIDQVPRALTRPASRSHAELVVKIKKAATFNQGFETTEYLASALMDLRYHMVDPRGIDPDAFERDDAGRAGHAAARS